MKRYLKITASLFFIALLILPAQFALAQPRGSVSGKVELALSADTPKRNIRRQYGHADHLPKKEAAENNFDDVVVYLEEISPRRNYSSSGKAPLLTQKNAAFIPKVLPILKGTTISIRNEDNIYHNVFSLSDTRSFNIGRRPQGESVPVSFDKAGEVRVFCDIHSNMSAYILVLETPYFVKPNSQGAYSIKDVPAGSYRVKAWHPRAKGDAGTVDVNGGDNTVNVLVK